MNTKNIAQFLFLTMLFLIQDAFGMRKMTTRLFNIRILSSRSTCPSLIAQQPFSSSGQSRRKILAPSFIAAAAALCSSDNTKKDDEKEDKNVATFFEALHSNDLDLMETLLPAININEITNHEGLLPIHVAANSPKILLETMLWLVKQGANINTQTKDGWTPLHLLASHQNKNPTDDMADAIKINLLLQSGAKTTLKNKQGDTLLHTAVRFKNTQAIFLLRSLNLLATNNDGKTAYDLALEAGWGKEFEKLIEGISEK